MPLGAPPADALEAILARVTLRTRRVDIFEADAVTPWMTDAPTLDGNVSVDSERDERRTVQLDFDNTDGRLNHYPEGFWYDKVIKVFSGVTIPAALTTYGSGTYGDSYASSMSTSWEAQIGEFIIDEISRDSFPHTTSVLGRDYTAKLLADEFGQTTTFLSGNSIDQVIRAIAINGGIVKMVVPQTGKFLSKDFSFEAGTTRWKAISDLATAHGYEVFFDATGYMIMREFRDPATSPVIFQFFTGDEGNLAKYKKSTNQTRLYNAVAVTGQAADQVTPVYAVAENHDLASPASIERLQRRKVYRYSSSFIETEQQAQDVADKFLAVHGLESYELSMDSIVLPWLEASDIIEFHDPLPSPGDPSRFLYSSFSLPLKLDYMKGVGKRVEMAA